jgi:hypothetical protein
LVCAIPLRIGWKLLTDSCTAQVPLGHSGVASNTGAETGKTTATGTTAGAEQLITGAEQLAEPAQLVAAEAQLAAFLLWTDCFIFFGIPTTLLNPDLTRSPSWLPLQSALHSVTKNANRQTHAKTKLKVRFITLSPKLRTQKNLTNNDQVFLDFTDLSATCLPFGYR